MTTFNSLDVLHLPLFGKHLIEASAGTGKTFNITRIYLRMLLEKKLDVQNILVMTFTKNATEELKGRISKEITDALVNWGNYTETDSFYIDLQNRLPVSEAKAILHKALLHMDEAAIFTIHGFCNRVLSNLAFESSLEFTINMEADTQELELEAVRDHYRFIAKQSEQDFETLTSKWTTPEQFYSAFRGVLSSDEALQYQDEAVIAQQHKALRENALAELNANKDALFEALVNSHKDKDKRTQEWQQLVDWLSMEANSPMPKLAKDFLNGNRFRKAELKALVQASTVCKNEADKLIESIKANRVYTLAFHAINVIRTSIVNAKARQQVMNFDDLIVTLQNVLRSDDTGTLAASIRQQFPVALVDEFQDTDPKQYEILSKVYGDFCNQTHQHALYMIGDPKQAIYGFRGGDIFAYLAARDAADANWIMDTNWRSTTEMIAGYNRLFFGEALPKTDPKILTEETELVGNDKVFGYDIEYVPVKASGKTDHKSLVESSNSSTQNSGIENSSAKNKALNINYFGFDDSYRPANSKKDVNKADFSTVIATWCASEISRLLNTEAQIAGRPLKESDIAVLVKTGTEAQLIESALSTAGLTSVYLSNKENLFDSVQARDLYQAIDGILHLEDTSKMIAALSTRYLGGKSSLFKAMQEDESLWEREQNYLRELKKLWEEKSFMAMAMRFVHETYTPEANQHERALTNTIHLLELLQQASTRYRQPRQLVRYLFDQITVASKKQESELRLESDANLIKIVTQHGSKGLEYPVVFIPYATKFSDPTRFGNQPQDIHLYHDDDNTLVRQLGQANDGVKKAFDEGLAESIRLLYVAVTRAVSRCYICATPFDKAHQSSLGLAVGAEDESQLFTKLLELANSQPDAISFNEVADIETLENNDKRLQAHQTPDQSKNESQLTSTPAVFNQAIENDWQLSSFSSLTKNVHTKRDPLVKLHLDDEDSEVEAQSIAADDIRFTLRKGAKTGNFLHDILERLDFVNPNYASACKHPLFSYGELPAPYGEQDLYEFLAALLHAPLPRILATLTESNTTTESGTRETTEEDTFSLSTLSYKQTLREVEFYFPIEGVDTQALSQLLAEHRGSSASIELPEKRQLKGMMHGFIDLVFEHEGKYYVADYKSTYLGDDISDYSETNITKDIAAHHYDLQYLIYCVALHRFLLQKSKDYDPSLHFGGVYYLYLRGMTDSASSGIYRKAIDSDLLLRLNKVMQVTTPSKPQEYSSDSEMTS